MWSRRHSRWQLGQAVAVGLALMGNPAKAQGVVPSPEVRGWTEAPGYYGTCFGVPSYRSVRTYSEFSSPYGGGYGYGYRPARIMPGRLGVGIWLSASETPPYDYRADSYRTWALPYDRTPGRVVATPPFGVYAPAFGPRTAYGW